MTEAEHPKGIEVVKDSIRKLKLDEEIRRAEGGKTPKVTSNIYSNTQKRYNKMYAAHAFCLLKCAHAYLTIGT